MKAAALLEEEDVTAVVDSDSRQMKDWKDADFLSLVPSDEEDGHETTSQEGNDGQDRSTTATAGLPVPTYTHGVRDVVVLPPWMERDPRSAPRRVNPLVALHNEIVDFCELMTPLPEEIAERAQLVERLKALVYEVFGSDKCQVCVFGSQATGLFLPSSDIDIVVQFVKEVEQEKNGTEEKSQEQKDMEAWDTPSASPLARLADALRQKWQDEISYLEVIENTRIPLVKFTHGLTNISVDVCFDQETGPKAAELMKTYLQAMPPLRPLTFVLKYFMDARGINEPYSGGVGSFMLQLMIVSFLQHRERDGYNFNRPCLANLGCLLLEFFELYGIDFNYITTGISIRHDGFYFPKGAKDRIENFWQQSRPFSLALENPLDPTADVGRASFRMHMVQRSFEVAFKMLLAHVTEPKIPAVSILASILPPTSEMKHRATLKRVDATLSRSLSAPRSTEKRKQRSSSTQSSSNASMELSSGEDDPRKRTKL